ncbi:unnamed protein product [Brassica oleracea]
MMVLHRSCEGALFLGGQKRPMRWQTHRYEWMFCFWIHRFIMLLRLSSYIKTTKFSLHF